MREITILDNEKLRKAPKAVKKLMLLLKVKEKEIIELSLSVKDNLIKKIKI